MNRNLFALSGLLASIVACTTAAPEPADTPMRAPDVSPNAAAAQSLAGSASALATQYGFPLHTPVQSLSNPHIGGFAGASETIATYNNLGGVTAFSGASSPQMTAGWPASVDVHDSMARAYLVRVGVPAAEMGTLHHFTGRSEGTPIASPDGTNGGVQVSLGFMTTFDRVISGISVPDSHAGVQLNQAGVPVTLRIAWPDIPSAVVQDAVIMASQLSSSWHLPASFVQSPGVSEGSHQVVIRHDVAGAPSLRFAAAVRTVLNGPRKSYVDTDLSAQPLTEFDPPKGNVGTK